MSIRLRDGYGQITTTAFALVVLSLIIGGIAGITYLHAWYTDATCTIGETSRAIEPWALQMYTEKYDDMSYEAHAKYIIITYTETCG